MDDKSQSMVWIDLEMTGLDIERESIIEILFFEISIDINIEDKIKWRLLKKYLIGDSSSIFFQTDM